MVELLPLSGGRVEYEDVPGAGPPLLFLHEGLGSVGLWRGFHRRVAETTGRRTVAYSRLGHGFSDFPARRHTTRFLHEEAERVLPELVERLDLDRPLLVAHSDGASIALLYAARQPVRGLVAMAPHAFVEVESIRGIRQARDAFDHGQLRERMARHHRDADVTFRQWNDIWLDPAFRDWNIEADLAGVTCPVLLVQGEADQYGTLAQLDAIERRVRGPIHRIVLPCAHSPHLECPDRMLAAVGGFVSDHGGGDHG